VTDRGNDLALVEAALFLSSQPMPRRALARILGDVRLGYVDGLLEDLAAAYQDSTRGIEILVDEGEALLRVKREYVERVAHLAPQQDIARPILRTLAVIAYNHPMTQADLVRVRGNKAYGHVQELIDRGLIRGDAHGRTLLLHVTSEFLQHFGLRTVEEFRFHAPPPEELISEDAPDEEDVPSASETGVSSDEEDVPSAGETGVSSDEEDAPSPEEGRATSEEEAPSEPTAASDAEDDPAPEEASSDEEVVPPDEAGVSSLDERARSDDGGEQTVTPAENVIQSEDSGGT